MLREQIDLDGIPVHVADTAGIRETEDRIEAEGVRRARQALQSADIVLLVEDADDAQGDTGSLRAEVPEGAVLLHVFNKIDRLDSGRRAGLQAGTGPACVFLSARTGEGMDRLRQRIREAVGAGEPVTGSFSARQRHVDALERCGAHLKAGNRVMVERAAGELLAEELRLAQQALGELTGERLPDDLLGEIFASFCIGK